MIADYDKAVGNGFTAKLAHMCLSLAAAMARLAARFISAIFGQDDTIVAPPAVDLQAERAHGEFVRAAIVAGSVSRRP